MANQIKAPPFILYAFLCFKRKNWLILAFNVFALGIQRTSWSGLDWFWILYGFSNASKKWVFSNCWGNYCCYLYYIQEMTLLQKLQDSWSMVLGPFQDIPEKIIYLLKILIPFGCLPLIFWRFGIIAGPAIGVNLLSGEGRPQMYSTSFHYDDISSTY